MLLNPSRNGFFRKRDIKTGNKLEENYRHSRNFLLSNPVVKIEKYLPPRDLELSEG
jgi:hypothetical protein